MSLNPTLRIRSLLWLTALCAGTTHGAAAERLYVSNERSGDITVIDPNAQRVLQTFPVGKRPRGIHLAPDGRTLYVAVSGSPRQGPGA